MRSRSPEWAASMGSIVGGSLGTGRLTGSSSLGSGDEALSARTGGVMGSFSAMSITLRSNRCPTLKLRGEASAELLNCSAQHPWGHSGLYSTPLKHLGQHHHLFSPHHLDVPHALEFCRREEVLFLQHM